MVRRFCALLLCLSVPAFAADVSEHLEACKEKYADCKEDCSMSFGTKVKYRTKLGKCLNKCKKTETSCRNSITELEEAGIDHESFANKPKNDLPEEKTPAKEEAPAVAKKMEEPEQTPEPVKETEKEEAPKPAAEKVAKKVDPPPPPPPKKDEPPPAPKKKEKALDEWDEGVIEH